MSCSCGARILSQEGQGTKYAASFVSPALRIQYVSPAARRLVLSSGRSSDSVALEQRNIMVIGREFLSLDLVHSQYHMYCVCTVECRLGDCTEVDTYVPRNVVYRSCFSCLTTLLRVLCSIQMCFLHSSRYGSKTVLRVLSRAYLHACVDALHLTPLSSGCRSCFRFGMFWVQILVGILGDLTGDVRVFSQFRQENAWKYYLTLGHDCFISRPV